MFSIQIVEQSGNIVSRYDSNKRIQAIEYIKELNRKNTDKIMDMYYNEKYNLVMNFDTFLEYFSLSAEFIKKRPYSLIDSD
jgi:hypothetical protein